MGRGGNVKGSNGSNGSHVAKDEADDRPGDQGGPGPTRRTRTETIDHAAQLRALREAFEAGGASARLVMDAQSAALKEAYAEIGRLHGLSSNAIAKSQELVGRLQHVANQNVSLTLAEQNGRVAVAEVEQKGLSLRHGATLLATNPFLGVVLKQLLPGLDIPAAPRPPGPGNTPIEAAQRLAASLRSGSEGSRMLLEVLENYCTEELQRPGDLALLVEFLNEIAEREPGEAKQPREPRPAEPEPEPTPEAEAAQ